MMTSQGAIIVSVAACAIVFALLSCATPAPVCTQCYILRGEIHIALERIERLETQVALLQATPKDDGPICPSVAEDRD